MNHHEPNSRLQSCLRTKYTSKRDSTMLKSRFKKRVAFVPSLFPKRVIKNAFEQSAFRVSRNVIFSFSHTLRAHNAICVAYNVVVSFVEFYMYEREMTIPSDKDVSN